MVEILKDKYWSKSKSFLLPLTGITRIPDFDINSYIQWNEYSIENYQLIVKIEYGARYQIFEDYIKSKMLSNQRAFATEIYDDFEGFAIVIFDMSSWASDVDLFLQGKYSKMSQEAKKLIQEYHLVFQGAKAKIHIGIHSCLYPNQEEAALDNMTPIEYVIEHYVMTGKVTMVDEDTAEAWRKTGELCSKCNIEKETLVLESSQSDSFAIVE